MFTKEDLCKKIATVFPDIGQCGIDVKVDFEGINNAWVVDLTKDKHNLKTYLEENEANDCMNGKQCVSLGLQIAQLRKNIEMT